MDFISTMFNKRNSCPLDINKETINRAVKVIVEFSKNSEKITSNMKCYMSANKALQKEAKTITDDLGKHLKPSHLLEERLLDMVKMGGTVTEDQAALFEELNSNCIKTVLEPMKKITKVIPTIEDEIKLRHQLAEKNAKGVIKIEKLKNLQQTGKNKAKLLTANLDLKQSNYDILNKNRILMEELPIFDELSMKYTENCMQTLLISQIKFYEDSEALFKRMSDEFECEKLDDEIYLYDMAVTFKQLNKCSIVNHE